MNFQLTTASLSGKINESSPLSQLAEIIDQCTRHLEDGCLALTHGPVTWTLYIADGKLFYISHSLDFAERIDVHLRRLSASIPALTTDLLAQVRLETGLEKPTSKDPQYGYLTICALVMKKLLTPEQASRLVFDLSMDALLSCFCLTGGEYRFESMTFGVPIFSRLDPKMVIPSIRRRLKLWQNLGPVIHSPYQRLYIGSEQEASATMSEEEFRKLSTILRGFDFWHLSALLKEDELVVAQKLYQSILGKTIILREPQAPFDKLPPIPALAKALTVSRPKPTKKSSKQGLGGIADRHAIHSTYKIACIDDSPVVLQTIERYLENHNLSILLINNPVRALMEVIRAKPNLILLDVGMPKVDGYELCRLIRRNANFKSTPIIMVTGNSGLIDRAKAKIAGATDYMTKPFTQDQLSKMVFRYLSRI